MWFSGEYERKLDAKQRLAIPSEVRAMVVPEHHGTGFYLTPGGRKKLWLWPQRTLQNRVAGMERDRSLNAGSETLAFDELFFSQLTPLEVDKTGRIRLPDHMLVRFKLGPAVTILGVRDHLELWNTTEWQTFRDQCMEDGRYDEIMFGPTPPDQE